MLIEVVTAQWITQNKHTINYSIIIFINDFKEKHPNTLLFSDRTFIPEFQKREDHNHVILTNHSK